MGSRLDLLVENQGRICYGSQINEQIVSGLDWPSLFHIYLFLFKGHNLEHNISSLLSAKLEPLSCVQELVERD